MHHTAIGDGHSAGYEVVSFVICHDKQAGGGGQNGACATERRRRSKKKKQRQAARSESR